MLSEALLPVHQILTDRTELLALSWSLFYILDLPAHLAWAGLGGLVSSPVAPRVATDTLILWPDEAPPSANQRAETGPVTNQRPASTGCSTAPTLATILTFKAGVTRVLSQDQGLRRSASPALNTD